MNQAVLLNMGVVFNNYCLYSQKESKLIILKNKKKNEKWLEILPEKEYLISMGNFFSNNNKTCLQ